MFTEWLLDQQDRTDNVGRLARLVWDDHNAGCAVMYPDPVSWKKHFEARHAAKLPLLMEMLGDAYVEYATQLDPRMASK